jgi:hypothetical protein
MSERHQGEAPPESVQKEQKKLAREHAFLLYSDFNLPELGQSKPLGRILDEEVFIAYDIDQNDKGSEKATYWIGNQGTLGWRSIDARDPRIIWQAFEEISKHKLFWDAMKNQGGEAGTGYWWQKHISGRTPGSESWREWSGNPPEIKTPEKI